MQAVNLRKFKRPALPSILGEGGGALARPWRSFLAVPLLRMGRGASGEDLLSKAHDRKMRDSGIALTRLPS
jgi:hypothetical protein